MEAEEHIAPNIALTKAPSPMPTQMSATQIVDPVWGQYNDPASLLNFLETDNLEL
jgi:hypothetical protein